MIEVPRLSPASSNLMSHWPGSARSCGWQLRRPPPLPCRVPQPDPEAVADKLPGGLKVSGGPQLRQRVLKLRRGRLDRARRRIGVAARLADPIQRGSGASATHRARLPPRRWRRRFAFFWRPSSVPRRGEFLRQ